ncbi:hypothetical protein Hanom_Chr14g01319621 [Helianthus anomalus]
MSLEHQLDSDLMRDPQTSAWYTCSQLFPEFSALLCDSFSAGGSDMSLIPVGDIGSFVTGASETTILFSSGPGRASLALHHIDLCYYIILVTHLHITYFCMCPVVNRLLTSLLFLKVFVQPSRRYLSRSSMVFL